MTATDTRAHGTRARYAHGPGPGKGPGCRCAECSAANRAAGNQRSRAILYGRWQPYVDAEPVREHLRALAAAGIGHRRVGELAGVSSGSLSKILYGGRGTGRRASASAREPLRRSWPSGLRQSSSRPAR